MEKSITEALRGENGNYILPFLWEHGEPEAVIREEIEKIWECGIGALCVEARPHPDFCGPGWWRDLGVILDECKKREMKVWILDDAHFPTGYANGLVAKKYPQHSKRYFKLTAADACGPMPGASYDARGLLNQSAGPGGMLDFLEAGLLKPELPQDDFLYAAAAYPVEPDGTLGEGTLLTGLVEDGVLHWDVPEGLWKLYLVTVTRTGGGKTSYVNWIDADSAALQIEGVYEPHWEHFREEFGETLAGFFSDEAEIGNCAGYNFDESIGRKEMPLPYSAELCSMMERELGGDWAKYLPVLWRPLADKAQTAKVRKAYMDAVSKLVSRNFTEALGSWCKAHGVEYIGHIIEDNNQHSRLGCSIGHFFRALSGQHMSGIDDIGNQVVFGGERGTRDGGVRGDGEFYHYALGKLGSSLGHIDPKKQGRTMCEIFGAYGWNEGTRLMKWLTDHFLARGVNVFVPHGFSPKEFPDPDCPPHFYARGNNPMYRPFGLLMRYMNRMCHVLSGGVHRCKAAILYHGESEWMGDAMFLQKPARELAERQIDFDILPSDTWSPEDPYGFSFADGVLKVNRETYRCLVIPRADFLPLDAARFAGRAAQAGFPVYLVDALPLGVAGGTAEENAAALAGLNACRVLPLERLAEELAEAGMEEVTLSPRFSMLRVYHYEKASQLYFLNNESPSETFRGTAVLPAAGVPVQYDAYENVLRAVPYERVGNTCVVTLELAPYESVLLSMEDAVPAEAALPSALHGEDFPVKGPWKVSYAGAKEYPEFSGEEVLETPGNISRLHPDFAGTIRYETAFRFSGTPGSAFLELPEAFEFAEAWLNGEKLGSLLCPPYRFSCGQALKAGENQLVLEITNTLDHQVKPAPGPFSAIPVTAPSGLLGNPVIHT